MFFPLRGNIYRRLGVVFSFLRFFPCWSGCSCVPSSKADFTSRNRGEQTLHYGGFEIGRIWWRPKKYPKMMVQVQPGSLGKTLVGQKKHRGFWHAQSMLFGAIYGFQGAVKTTQNTVVFRSSNLGHTQIISNPSSDWSHFSLFWLIDVDCLDCPPCVGHFLMITFAHWGGVKMCANRPPEGQAWNGARGRGWHCQPFEAERSISWEFQSSSSFTSLGVERWPQDFVAQGRPSTLFRTALA